MCSALPFFVCTTCRNVLAGVPSVFPLLEAGRRLPSVEGNSLHLLLRQTPVRICDLAISSGEAVKSVCVLSVYRSCSCMLWITHPTTYLLRPNVPPDEVEQLPALKVFHHIFHWTCSWCSVPSILCLHNLQECLSRVLYCKEGEPSMFHVMDEDCRGWKEMVYAYRRDNPR